MCSITILENVQVQQAEQTAARSAMPCRNCRIDYRERFWQRFHLVVGSGESGDNEIFCLLSVKIPSPCIYSSKPAAVLYRNVLASSPLGLGFCDFAFAFPRLAAFSCMRPLPLAPEKLIN